MSIDDMCKFEEKERKKLRSFKNTWCDWVYEKTLKVVLKIKWLVFPRQIQLNKQCMGEERNLTK